MKKIFFDLVFFLKKHKWVSFFVLITFVIFIQIVIVNLRLTVSLRTFEKEKLANKTASDLRYQELVEQQSVSVSERYTKIDDVKLLESELVGIQHLYVFFVRPPSTKVEEVLPLINRLMQFSTTQQDSIYSIHTFFAKESLKYNSRPFNLVIHTENKVEELEIESIGDFSHLWDTDVYSMQKLQDRFALILERNNVELDLNHHALFVYFDASNIATTRSDASFYDSKMFRSFTDELQHKAYVNAYSFSPLFASTLVEIAAHEVLHLFGARDKYIEDKYACEDLGRGNPDTDPIYPQTSADIMCGLIEKAAGKFTRANFQKGQLVVNRYTASEIGWLDDAD